MWRIFIKSYQTKTRSKARRFHFVSTFWFCSRTISPIYSKQWGSFWAHNVIEQTKQSKLFEHDSPRPIKLLAYAGDVLIFAKNKAEYSAIEDCLKEYSKASNSKVNFSKSIAFPLHGGNMMGHKGAELRNYIANNQCMKWFDYSSTGYVKYLGYPLWFSNEQRDTFVDKLSGKSQPPDNFYKTKNMPVYDRETETVITRLDSIIYHT